MRQPTVHGYTARMHAHQAKRQAIQWLAHRLPASLRYFAAVDIIAHASGGKYEKNTNVCDLLAMEALKRFGDDKHVEEDRRDD